MTVVGYKGGVGKTTCAVHLAACLQGHGPTLLIDGDINRSAVGWAESGRLPFQVVDENEAAGVVDNFEHVVIDTAARPNPEDLHALASGCDLVVLPTTPEAMALRALFDTASHLQKIPEAKFRVLLTIVPPRPSRDGEEARGSLARAGLPVFAASIRRAVAFTKASLEGCLVSEVADPRASVCWGDYLSVAEELGVLEKMA